MICLWPAKQIGWYPVVLNLLYSGELSTVATTQQSWYTANLCLNTCQAAELRNSILSRSVFVIQFAKAQFLVLWSSVALSLWCRHRNTPATGLYSFSPHTARPRSLVQCWEKIFLSSSSSHRVFLDIEVHSCIAFMAQCFSQTSSPSVLCGCIINSPKPSQVCTVLQSH